MVEGRMKQGNEGVSPPFYEDTNLHEWSVLTAWSPLKSPSSWLFIMEITSVGVWGTDIETIAETFLNVPVDILSPKIFPVHETEIEYM